MTTVIKATRFHDFCAGHRVLGHENKCAHLHGHNYRIHFTVEGCRDSVGRVLDFSVIKSILCDWLEVNWDHRFLVFKEDPWASHLVAVDRATIITDFNPTAENMAEYLLNTIAPPLLEPYGVILTEVVIEETRKCSASAALEMETIDASE